MARLNPVQRRRRRRRVAVLAVVVVAVVAALVMWDRHASDKRQSSPSPTWTPTPPPSAGPTPRFVKRYAEENGKKLELEFVPKAGGSRWKAVD